MGRRRGKLPPNWQLYVRRRGWSEYRVMLWAGLLLGLLLFQAMRVLPISPAGPPDLPDYSPPRAAPPSVPDPYAEARRSRENLEAQSAAPGDAADLAGSAPSGQRVSGPVRVIDGDTFDYAGGRVRIADIDAPETHPSRCPYEAELGARATRRLHTLLAAGPFELRPLGDGRDTDRYGRRLRIVTRGGQSLGDVLVTEGLARTWTGRREPWCLS